jgi:Alpha/beta hydrolase domain
LADKSRATVSLMVSAAILSAPYAAYARVTKIVIEATKPVAADGNAIAYEIVTGRFYGEVDPESRENAIITDLRLAPRNARGRVEYSATFAIARPIDASKASGVLFYDVPNRGNGGVAADPDGHVRVISGWQGDLPENLGLQTLQVPTAIGPNGRALAGPVFARFVDSPEGVSTLPITGSIGRPTAMPEPVSLDPKRAKLYVQSRSGGKLTALSPKVWAFADCTKTPFPGVSDPARLCLKVGFDPSLAYTLVYTAKNPKVMGLGFAATRDLVAYLRHAKTDDFGTPNPAGAIRWAVASGTSQSGNFLKSFVHLGFNVDEEKRIVFDGINPNIAARQVPLNLRFSIPGGAARPYEPGSEGTLWWGRYADTVRGRGTSSLLDRCTKTSTCPKVIETFGSAEFWGLRMGPGLTGTKGDTDIPLPDNVRRYYFPSVTHGGSWTGGFPLKGDPIPAGCLLPGNPNPMLPELRMSHRFLIDWVKGVAVPPASVYPTLANGDLVTPTASALGWPSIPGAPSPDGKINPLPQQDFGKSMRVNDMSGVLAILPPRLGANIPQFVPRLDADGNEIAGIRSVQLMVPLGTYLGWNVQAHGFSKGEGCGFAGGYIPFARTRLEREAAGDPRLSLEERYKDQAGFVAQVRAAVIKHQEAGWLSSKDATQLMTQAESADIFKARDQ